MVVEAYQYCLQHPAEKVQTGLKGGWEKSGHTFTFESEIFVGIVLRGQQIDDNMTLVFIGVDVVETGKSFGLVPDGMDVPSTFVNHVESGDSYSVLKTNQIVSY